MKCPFCGHPDTQVVETRVSEEGDFVRRRRQCGACDKRFTTYERPDVSYPVIVKKDGSREDFEPRKLRGSMMLALRKRPVSAEEIERAQMRIEQSLLLSGDREMASNRLGELVMRELKTLDKVAYVRFASVYRSFEDVDEFRQLLKDIEGGEVAAASLQKMRGKAAAPAPASTSAPTPVPRPPRGRG